MSPPPSERSPLLPNGSEQPAPPARSFAQKATAFFKAEGEPGWIASYKHFLLGSWLNVLLIFIPLSFISHHLNWDAALRFVFSFIAIVPLAKVRGARLSPPPFRGD